MTTEESNACLMVSQRDTSEPTRLFRPFEPVRANGPNIAIRVPDRPAVICSDSGGLQKELKSENRSQLRYPNVRVDANENQKNVKLPLAHGRRNAWDRGTEKIKVRHFPRR